MTCTARTPISPLYFDIGGWWDCDGRWGADCTYMYQRFGAPIGKAWIAKKIGGYVYSAVVPPETDADKVGPMFDYYTKVMPIYADTFMDRWKKEYVPRLQQMQNAILDFDFEHKSLPEIMIHMEDMLDMKSGSLNPLDHQPGPVPGLYGLHQRRQGSRRRRCTDRQD